MALHVRVFYLVLQHGRTPLHTAAIYGKEGAAAALIAAGSPLELKDKDGNTPLLLAARYGKLPIVKLLVKAGADLKAMNAMGHCPVDAARHGGSPETEDFLVDTEVELGVA